MKKRFGNCVEGISREKLRKQGYEMYMRYWSDTISQQNILTKLPITDYVYTQKRDKSGLFRVIIYAKVAA